MEGASPACWSQPSGKASKGSWNEENHSNWIHCDHSHRSKVPVMLLLCLCGMVGNRAVLWLLGFHRHRNPISICVLTLAMADFAFLLSITIALGVFLSLRASATSWACDRAVASGLNVTILLTSFPAGICSLTAFSAVTALFVLPVSCWTCHHSQHFPLLLCALLWLLSFLFTVTLCFHPSVLMALVLSYLFSVLTLTCSGLTLLPRLLCCSWKLPPGKLCALLLLPVVSLPFFTAHFGYWFLLRAFDFSVFALSTSLMLPCANSSAHPLIYFLAGSCAKEFTLSGSVAFQRALRMCQSQGIGTALWNHHQVESS